MDAQTNVGIYGNGLFQDGSTPYDEQLRQLLAARFDTITLWALHAHENGDLFYNDDLAVRDGQLMTGQGKLNPLLPELVRKLRVSAGLRTFGFSIGPFAEDFQRLAADTARAATNLKPLIAALGIDSVDFDFEGACSDADRRMIVELTLLMHALGVAVSYCPYTAEDFWLGCLTDVYAQLGSQPVWAYNLQCYDGGDGNDPIAWAQTLQASARPTGVADPIAFVQPGYWVANRGPESFYGKCPRTLEGMFAALGPRGVRGGWLWNSGDVFANEQAGLCPGQDVTPAGYRQALAKGLGGVPALA